MTTTVPLEACKVRVFKIYVCAGLATYQAKPWNATETRTNSLQSSNILVVRGPSPVELMMDSREIRKEPAAQTPPLSAKPLRIAS